MKENNMTKQKIPELKSMTPAQFKKRREELKYSIPQLAKRIGRGRTTINKWEDGTHKIPASIAELMQYIEPLPHAEVHARVIRTKAEKNVSE